MSIEEEEKRLKFYSHLQDIKNMKISDIQMYVYDKFIDDVNINEYAKYYQELINGDKDVKKRRAYIQNMNAIDKAYGAFATALKTISETEPPLTQEGKEAIMKEAYNTIPKPIDLKGGRRNKPNYADMTMKDIKELCKANQIKLSRVVNDKRVAYKKKELITKLKRKKVI